MVQTRESRSRSQMKIGELVSGGILPPVEEKDRKREYGSGLHGPGPAPPPPRTTAGTGIGNGARPGATPPPPRTTTGTAMEMDLDRFRLPLKTTRANTGIAGRGGRRGSWAETGIAVAADDCGRRELRVDTGIAVGAGACGCRDREKMMQNYHICVTFVKKPPP